MLNVLRRGGPALIAIYRPNGTPSLPAGMPEFSFPRAALVFIHKSAGTVIPAGMTEYDVGRAVRALTPKARVVVAIP